MHNRLPDKKKTDPIKVRSGSTSSQTIKDHFKVDTNCGPQTQKEIKMAAATKAAENDATPAEDSPILQYLKAMEASLTDRITTLTSHVEEIKLSVSQAIEKADSALENSLTNQANLKLLGEHVLAANDRLTSVETEQKATNLKFRGFPEETEGSEDLISFIASFIAQALKLEKGIYPVITNAARLGSKNNAKRTTPRDIVATIPDVRVCRRILQEGQKAKTFVYNDQPIDVFPYIPREALQIRRKLKATTKQLQELHQKYRWLPSGKLFDQINCKLTSPYQLQLVIRLLLMLFFLLITSILHTSWGCTKKDVEEEKTIQDSKEKCGVHEETALKSEFHQFEKLPKEDISNVTYKELLRDEIYPKEEKHFRCEYLEGQKKRRDMQGLKVDILKDELEKLMGEGSFYPTQDVLKNKNKLEEALVEKKNNEECKEGGEETAKETDHVKLAAQHKTSKLKKQYVFSEVIENLHQGLPSSGPISNTSTLNHSRQVSRQQTEVKGENSVSTYEPSFGNATKIRQNTSTHSEDHTPTASMEKKNTLMEELFGPTCILKDSHQNLKELEKGKKTLQSERIYEISSCLNDGLQCGDCKQTQIKVFHTTAALEDQR
ncbi:UNVERIFIED_CONTAM: hypothetical protein K2H54_055143 [Gekko kuhli]